ncbi:MAG: KTSC domain-containing protein [Christensenellales bacterium]
MIANSLFSRRIDDFSYDSEKAVLTIRFHSGVTKQYFDVPQKISQGLCEASDKNQFYQEQIDGKFRIE